MRSYSHLFEDERDQIGILRAAGQSMSAIARALGRAKTTTGQKPLKLVARLAIGRAILSSASAPGPCSSCMSASPA